MKYKKTIIENYEVVTHTYKVLKYCPRNKELEKWFAIITQSLAVDIVICANTKEQEHRLYEKIKRTKEYDTDTELAYPNSKKLYMYIKAYLRELQIL